MARYTNITRPCCEVPETVDANFHINRGYCRVSRDSGMSKHIEDWMIPASAYPHGSWVPVWIYLLWERSETPAGWKNRVRELRVDHKTLVTLLVSELLRRKDHDPPELIVAIKACLAKHRRGTT